MPALVKTFRSAFVLDMSKVTRIMGIVKERLVVHPDPQEDQFDVELSGLKHVHCDLLDQVLEMDNSKRSRIERLVISCGATKDAGTGRVKNAIRLDFDGHRPVDATVAVQGEDSKWATETMSLLEEQVERTLSQSIIHRIANHRELVLAIATVAAFFMSLFMILALTKFDARLSATMWLTPQDLKDLNDKHTTTANVGTDDWLRELSRRQIQNLVDQHQRSPWRTVADWRVLVVLLPIVILFAALIYLIRLYPPAVFLWGDAEEWYMGLVRKRNTVWTVIIATLLLGLIANIAVLGLGSLLSGRPHS
jgi:hypothetical protein